MYCVSAAIRGTAAKTANTDFSDRLDPVRSMQISLRPLQLDLRGEERTEYRREWEKRDGAAREGQKEDEDSTCCPRRGCAHDNGKNTQ